MDVVLRLRELRRTRGLTQAEAAARARLGPKTLSSFESGARTSSMKLSQLLQLLAAYGVTPAAFFDETRELDDVAEREPRGDLGVAMRSLERCPPDVRAPVLSLIATITAQLPPNQRLERRADAPLRVHFTQRRP